MRFKEYLNEAVKVEDIDFADLTMIDADAYKYTFTTANGTYSVVFERADPSDSVWERSMTFQDPLTGKKTYNATNFGVDVYKILGIQFGCLKAFLSGMLPNVVTFTASKADRSRANVYEGILRRMNLSSMGYSYRSVDEGADIRFFVEKI